jgi:hypothetical protein
MELDGHTIHSMVQAWQLYARNPDDCDPVWENIPAQKPGKSLELRGTSITVIEYKTE